MAGGQRGRTTFPWKITSLFRLLLALVLRSRAIPANVRPLSVRTKAAPVEAANRLRLIRASKLLVQLVMGGSERSAYMECLLGGGGIDFRRIEEGADADTTKVLG